MKAISSLHN